MLRQKFCHEPLKLLQALAKIGAFIPITLLIKNNDGYSYKFIAPCSNTISRYDHAKPTVTETVDTCSYVAISRTSY